MIAELDALNCIVDEATCRRIFNEAELTREEVAPYVEEQANSYGRRSVARRENYEVLVLTWKPGQASVAHDHSGSLCGLKVAQGQVIEQFYELGPDGQVRPAGSSAFGVGETTVDPGVVVHSLGNAASASETLVSVHLYSPPLPEVRRYSVTTQPPSAVFLREKAEEAKTVAVIGGGFTGTMVLANLLRLAPGKRPLHFVLIDKQPATGEGVAYRTNDARHLLNVPAGKMSAWPDQPEDFLRFARGVDPGVGAGDFLPRKLYGKYVRQTLLELAEQADGNLSVEMIRDEATALAPQGDGWKISTGKGGSVKAEVVVVALGHRPPRDEFSGRWSGPRTRFVADPWAALVLSQVGPDEPVLLLGSGLTAVDCILTLNRPERTAPLIVVSRRGLLPQAHAINPQPPTDCAQLIDRWLGGEKRLTARDLARGLREFAEEKHGAGPGWRAVIDGLRPFIAKIWCSLDAIERERFLRHVRPFWEVHRHRMAPSIAAEIGKLQERKIVEVMAGSLVGAEADGGGVDVTLRFRGRSRERKERVAWVINCTGPGAQNRHTTHPILRPLIQSGVICDDGLGLGVPTDQEGRALKHNGKAHANLLIAGTLRKANLWESTAAPELRQQAADVAKIALRVATMGAGELGSFSI